MIQTGTNSTHPLKLYDRSRTVTDWSCPRKRWYQYEYDGRGVVGTNTYLELFLGQAIHDGLAVIAKTHQVGQPVDMEQLVDAARKQITGHLLESTAGEVEDVNFANEQAALIEGLLRGFYKTAWPNLTAKYPKVLFVEEEMEYEHDGLLFMSKPDLILATEDESDIVYVEYKSTSSKREEWINSWDTAIQLHSTIRAVKATKGIDVSSVIVQGLYKGYESYGKQTSPFCYAYHRSGQAPFSVDQISYDYKSGFKKYPTWELAGGVKQWVDNMPPDILSVQFPQTPPIYVKDYMLDAFFAQRATRENEIKLATDLIEFHKDDPESVNNILNAAFPQKFDVCQPGWGKPCPYRILCHSGVTDPHSAGFQPREAHHQKEMEKFENEASQTFES